jgi:hypothetical protein
MVHCGACGQPLVIRSADILEDKIVLRARCSGCQRVWLAEVPQSAFYTPDARVGEDTSEPSRVAHRAAGEPEVMEDALHRLGEPSGYGDGQGGD